MADLGPAFGVAFERPWAYLVGLASAAGMALLIAWSSGLLAYYRTGWEVYASPPELAAIGVLSVLFGLLVPLQLAGLAKARSAAGTVGGIAGTATGILSVSCCAPLLIPSLLSFVGVPGTALASFNASMRGFATPLTLASIVLMAGSIGMVSHTITAACKLPAASAAKDAA